MTDSPEERPASPPPGSAEEALRRLEQRLDRATEAAERLMAEAAAQAGAQAGAQAAAQAAAQSAGAVDPTRPSETAGNPSASSTRAGGAGEPVQPPPAGWQIPEDPRDGNAPSLDPLLSLVQAVRELIPPELQRRLVAALRELLLALRALIDWYLERLERRREESVQVEDIPIL